MKFSTKGRYALRMMIEFALRPGECTKINHVAERQDISDILPKTLPNTP
ncbi:MAG: transcriptional regulator, BadM/Rrf2 family [Lacrimispora sp.]|nr:transcriptional regulator, BadM/Rrf2 family [Lacrimispora sp.]